MRPDIRDRDPYHAPDCPYWIEDTSGMRERLTRRWDRSSQMLGTLLAIGFALAMGFGLGVVHGRTNPLPDAHIAAMRNAQ